MTTNNPSDPDFDTQAADDQHRQIFEEYWSNDEMIMDALCSDMIPETVAPLIRHLPKDDPVRMEVEDILHDLVRFNHGV